MQQQVVVVELREQLKELEELDIEVLGGGCSVANQVVVAGQRRFEVAADSFHDVGVVLGKVDVEGVLAALDIGVEQVQVFWRHEVLVVLPLIEHLE